MRTLLSLFLLCVSIAFGQPATGNGSPQPARVIFVSVAPTVGAACSNSQAMQRSIQSGATNGHLYSCQGGLWADISGGTSSGNVTCTAPTVVGNLLKFTNTLGTGCDDSGIAVVSGGLSMTGGISTGGATNSIDGTAGGFQCGQGTAPSGLATTGIQIICPTSVTSWRGVLPGAVGVSGFFRASVSSTTATYSNDLIATADLPVALLNQTSLRGNAMAAAAGDATIAQVIAHGSKALDFASTATGACATVITDTATGTASTDTIIFTTNASIKAVTGYVPASTGGFSINAYPTANTVNFEACNWTAGTVDPGSITVNWKVIR